MNPLLTLANPLANPLASPLVSPFSIKLGSALLHFVWQGTLIACITGVLLTLLRNARPQTRYALACASLALCLVLPIMQILMFDTPLPLDSVSSILPGAQVAHSPSLAQPNNINPARTRPQSGRDPQSSTDTPLFTWSTLTPWAVLLWSLGLCLLTLRMAWGLLWLRRLHQRPALFPANSAPPFAQWQHKLERMTHHFGLSRTIDLRFVNGLDSPLTAGWWRPVIFVPAALISGMSQDFLEALLAHELAHIKRHDYLINLIQSAIETLLFYHPAVWWISKQIRIEREQIADDLAASSLGDTRRLALALQQLDLFQSSINQFAQAANGGILMSRIKRLIRPETRNLNWKIALPLAGLTLTCSVLYSNVNADTARKPEPSATMPAMATNPAMAATTPTAPTAPTASTAAPEATAATRRARTAPPAPPAPPPAPPAPPAPLALPTPPTPPAPPAYKNQPNYALVTKAGKIALRNMNAAQRAKVLKMQADANSDFLWFQQNGKSWMVTDPSLVANAFAAHAQTESLDQKMAALEQQMSLESKNLETISSSMAHIEHDKANQAMQAATEKLASGIAAIGSQQGVIGAEMGVVGAKMANAESGAEREQLQQQMAQLRSRMEPLRKEMKEAQAVLKREMKQLTESLAPLHALGAEMREKSRPLVELGQQMAQLGMEHAQAERDAARAINEIIQKSLETGVAKPL